MRFSPFKKMLLATVIASALFVGYLYGQVARPLVIQVVDSALVNTTCPTPSSGVTQFCFAYNGIWQSLNGATYTQLGAAASGGVTSFNGQTGAVTGVTSVNGKTGPAVTIGASSSTTTTLN